MTFAAASVGACRRAATRAPGAAAKRDAVALRPTTRRKFDQQGAAALARNLHDFRPPAAGGRLILPSTTGAATAVNNNRSLSSSTISAPDNDDATSSSSTSTSLSSYDLTHPDCNVTPNIASRVGRNLHLISSHPLHTVKSVIYDYWTSLPNTNFSIHDEFSPVVPTNNNFDSLLIPPDHVSRSKSDTYYLNKETVLRTHTSAHQTTLLSRGEDQFLVTGDVYRRDEIDSSHYPVFHQMEGVRMFTDDELSAAGVDIVGGGTAAEEEGRAYAESDLKVGLEGMARALFGDDIEMRWVDEYFPFTDPSFELEIYFGGEWMEVLGCGVVHRDIVRNVGRGSSPGWAFGLGLERLAMVLFSIPDIRLFWSDDIRFHSQFEGGGIDVTFRPYSKYPACYKDISFWTTTTTTSSSSSNTNDFGGSGDDGASSYHENDFYEIVREVGGDLIERVELIDDFTHPKTGRTSHCYRVSYRSMDRVLTNDEIDRLQERVRDGAAEKLGVELR